MVIRSHFGSSHFLLERALCFSRSRAFWFCLVHVSTTQFCSFPPFLVARATEQMCRYLRRQPPLRIRVLLTVLFLTLKEQDFAPVRWRRKSTTSTYSYRSSYRMRQGSKIASKCLLRQWPPRRLRLQILNKLLGALWLASLLWKQMQLLVPVALIQQDFGTCLDRVTAPQPLVPSGPMVQGHPMTIGIRDVDLILFQALKTNMHSAVLLRSHVRNTTVELRIGSTSRVCVGQTRIRNKSQVSGLCGPI